MPVWQIALTALVAAWALQAAGTFYQMRHYRAVMSDVSGRWSDGFVGAGSAKSTLGRGVILLLVVDADTVVRRLCVMQGRSVFAKFRTVPTLEGQRLATLRARSPFDDKGRTKALGVAIALIDKAMTEISRETPAAAAA